MNAQRPAWVLGHVTVRNAKKWDRYRQRVPQTIAPFGGKVLLRGAVMDILDGAHRHTDAVVLEFPDLDAARGWHASTAYQALIALRREAADIDLVIVGG
ncbi:MAG TPA: DUF1330 domain-containing protein [Casimicrobiaceae bacterium]|jgi:uncharacterized protein (DUF1330 family)